MRQIKIRIRHDIDSSGAFGDRWTDAVRLTPRAWREVWNECGDDLDTAAYEGVVGDGTVKFIQDEVVVQCGRDGEEEVRPLTTPSLRSHRR